MKPFECASEDEVLAAVGTSRWPDRVDAELRAHVAQCAVCRDLVAVAVAFAAPESSAAGAHVPSPRLPDSGVVWLRAQMRARQEAARTAVRPITVAQALSFASVIGLFGVLLGASSAWLQRGVRGLMAMVHVLDPRGLTVPASLVVALSEHATLIASTGAILLLIPAALYLAMREPRT